MSKGPGVKAILALQQALSIGNMGINDILEIEPWSMRYTTRGDLWLLRNKITGQIMEPWCSDSEGYDGYLVNAFTGKVVAETYVQWDYADCEEYALCWDNLPEFKDARRGVLDLVTYDESMLKKAK